MVETQYKTVVRGWMSDAGGEFKSKAFISMLTERGIKILQSIPHAHQQIGRAERIIQTLMEKAESMRLQACLPQSWWEFALDHATHVYNRTPICRLSWCTPSEWLSGNRPSVDHLQVLGCGAYVFIPAEVRTNKLAPKSELMTYLGSHPGGKGWIFMRGPNNVIFSAAQAIFDESIFLKCPKSLVQVPNTRLQSSAPKPQKCAGENCHCPLPFEDEIESYPEHPVPSGSKGKAPEPAGREIAHKGRGWKTGDEVPSGPPVVPIPAPPQQHPEQRRPQERRRSGRVPKPLIKPDNVYGSKTPVEIEKDINKQRDWKRIVGEESSRLQRGSIPGPSRQPPLEPLLEEEGSESEDKVEESLDPFGNEELLTVNRLCREGGVAFQHFLVSKAIVRATLARS